MDMMDYSLVSDIYLVDSGLLFSDSTLMVKFLSDNKIAKVGNFLKVMDDESFMLIPSKETLNQARGLADLVRFKYFNISLLMKTYLDSLIVKHNFNVCVDGCVRLSNEKRFKRKCE